MNEVRKIDLLVGLLKAGQVPLLVGPAGIGKTAVVYEIGNRLNMPVIEIPLQLTEPEDFLGLPQIVDGQTKFTRPDWFPSQPAIVFLDEFNRANPRILGALLKLLWEHRVGSYILPAGSMIIAAMNPATDDYEVEELTDQALLSRVIQIPFDVNSKEWIEWARMNKLNQAVIDFIHHYPEWLLTTTGEVRCNPRSWEKVSQIMNGLTEQVKDAFLPLVLNKIIGVHASKAFLQFIDGSKSLDPRIVFTDPDSILDLSPDKQIIVLERAFNIAVDEKMLDGFANSINKVLSKLQKEVAVGFYRHIADNKDEKAQAALKALLAKPAFIKLASMVASV